MEGKSERKRVQRAATESPRRGGTIPPAMVPTRDSWGITRWWRRWRSYTLRRYSGNYKDGWSKVYKRVEAEECEKRRKRKAARQGA